jgi:hypothetical protein
MRRCAIYAVLVGIIGISMLAFSCAQNRFKDACLERGGTVGQSSNGYATCSKS